MRIWPILLIIFLGGCVVQAVQQEVMDNYVNKDKLIYSYPGKQSSEYLSESISLYMEYLVLVEDESAFEQQYEVLKKHFIVKQEDKVFVRWRLYENVNALIDDVRLIHALNEASSKFNEPQYEELASNIEKTISQVQKSEGYTVDYFDWKVGIPAQRITLSYLTKEVDKSQNDKDLLENVDMKVVFFPEYYDINKQEYSFNNEVHMIDQLLIAINREEMGSSSPLFEEWLLKEWSQNEKVYGRYSRETLAASVEYESLSVYYYLKMYLLKIGEDELAEAVQQHAKEMEESSDFKETHFFDYIHFQMMKEIS